jgi:hypothetical protein
MKMAARQEPAHVAPQEAALHRRVHVRTLVRMRMMMAMMRGPPDRSALHGGGAEHREDELTGARGLERAMREVAVIKTGDGEHAYRVERHGRDDSRRAHANVDHTQAGKVHSDERQHAHPVDAIDLRFIRHHHAFVGVQPRQQATGKRALLDGAWAVRWIRSLLGHGLFYGKSPVADASIVRILIRPHLGYGCRRES